MTLRSSSIATAALSLLLISASSVVVAADTKAPAPKAKATAAAPAEPSPEEVANMRRATHILRAFNVALEAKEVTQPVKARLINCLYNNKLSMISMAAGNAIKQDAALSDEKPSDVYRAAAGVCGIEFKATAAEAAPAAKTTPGANGR